MRKKLGLALGAGSKKDFAKIIIRRRIMKA
jgi:hypothetical protein